MLKHAGAIQSYDEDLRSEWDAVFFHIIARKNLRVKGISYSLGVFIGRLTTVFIVTPLSLLIFPITKGGMITSALTLGDYIFGNPFANFIGLSDFSQFYYILSLLLGGYFLSNLKGFFMSPAYLIIDLIDIFTMGKLSRVLFTYPVAMGRNCRKLIKNQTTFYRVFIDKRTVVVVRTFLDNRTEELSDEILALTQTTRSEESEVVLEEKISEYWNVYAETEKNRQAVAENLKSLKGI